MQPPSSYLHCHGHQIVAVMVRQYFEVRVLRHLFWLKISLLLYIFLDHYKWVSFQIQRHQELKISFRQPHAAWRHKPSTYIDVQRKWWCQQTRWKAEQYVLEQSPLTARHVHGPWEVAVVACVGIALVWKIMCLKKSAWIRTEFQRGVVLFSSSSLCRSSISLNLVKKFKVHP